MRVRLSDYDVVALAYLKHAYYWHYIDFTKKTEYLAIEDAEISKLNNSIEKGMPIPQRDGVILVRLRKEFERTAFIRNALLWLMRQYELTPDEEDLLGKAEARNPLKLESWSERVPSRLFNLAEGTPNNVRRLIEFGDKLSELVESRVTPGLPGMSADYGDTKYQQALAESCRNLPIDATYVLSLVDEPETDDPLVLLAKIPLKKSTSAKTDQGSEEFEYDVFLSYASADNEKADCIRKALQTEKLTCFMAGKEIKGGDQWSNKVRKALRTSREVCLLSHPIRQKANGY